MFWTCISIFTRVVYIESTFIVVIDTCRTGTIRKMHVEKNLEFGEHENIFFQIVLCPNFPDTLYIMLYCLSIGGQGFSSDHGWSINLDSAHAALHAVSAVVLSVAVVALSAVQHRCPARAGTGRLGRAVSAMSCHSSTRLPLVSFLIAFCRWGRVSVPPTRPGCSGQTPLLVP